MSGTFRRARHAIAAALACAALFAAPAAAQVVRAFTPRFSVNQPGDITLIGNTVMSCNGGGNCNNSRAGTGNAINNNDNTMAYVDIDGVSTTVSSSTATLTLPTGATVTWAGLYWGGYTTNALRNTVKIATPASSAYSTYTATRLDASGSAYQGFAEVTSLVRAAGAGVYRVADVRSTPGTTNVHGGWSLVVVDSDATQPARNLVVFDGFALVSGTTTVNMTVSGFVTPPAGTVNSKLGVVAFEGDLGFTGDSFRLNGTALTDGANPADNFFNSSISQLGAPFTAKNPNYLNQLGFDCDLVQANGLLANGATSANVSLTTNGDTYYPGAVTFATDLYAPVFDAANFSKSVADLNGGLVRPGDVLEYTVTMRNNGLDHAIDCAMADTLPSNVTYVAGSLRVSAGPNAGAKTDAAGDDAAEYVGASRSVVARLGTGATAAAGGRIDVATTTSVVFRVTVNAPQPTGTAVSNQAALAFTGQQSGVDFAARSDGDPATGGTQSTIVTVTAARIAGTVFEDANYGGGAGRSLAASSGAPRPGARVELYDGTSGAFLQLARTDGSGAYVFDGWPAGAYTVRVANASVRSSRPGAIAGLLPVQTWRTDASSGAPVAVTDRVGGENPAIADADSNTTAAALASLAAPAATPQSVTNVTLGAADVTGVDFGFNFDTIVSTRDAGAGTLRQFLLNANALANTGLAQAGLPAGGETSVFMIPDGLAHPGLRAGLANALVNGVARIVPLTPLPAITDAATRVDGGTQTANVGNTNGGVLGAAPTVGTDEIALAAVSAPEVELRDANGLALGLDVQGASVTVRALAVLGFGNATGSNNDACVRVGAAANAFTLEDAVLGATARAFADSGAALRASGDLLRAVGGDAGLVQRSLLGFAAGSAVTLSGASNGWTIQTSEIRGVAIGNGARGAVSLEASGTLAITSCWIGESEGNGVDARTSTGGVTLTNLTVRRNGLGTAAATATAGVRLGGAGGTVQRCEIALNVGAGVQVTSGASNHVLSRNSIWGNGTVAGNGGGTASGQIGIDLQAAADDAARGTAPYVTRNDNGDGDAGGNALLNHPVMDYAVLSNGSFTVSGWARPGSVIELFVADGDPSGFGEGRTYVTTVTEGSAADLDGTSSTYSGLYNGVNQGTDNTRRFRFTMPAPPNVSASVVLTATATVTGTGTSEFSGGVPVTTGVSVSGWAYSDADHDAQRDAGEAGTGVALWAKLFAAGSPSASQVAAVDGASGAFAFTFVASGSYVVKLDTSADGADSTADVPAGWVRTEAPTGERGPLDVAATDVSGATCGLWHGSVVRGVRFRDDGAGGGVANDGARSGAEGAIAGARVRLTSAACGAAPCDSALTDGAGAFALWLPHTLAGANVSVVAPVGVGAIATGGRVGDSFGTYDRAAPAVTFTAASGREYRNLAFGEVPRNAWIANGARTVSSGAATSYAHTFTAASGGSVSFSSAGVATPALAGWSMTLYRDLDCDGVLDAGESAIAPASAIALAAGQSVCVIATHATPAGAPTGAREQATLTASFTYANAAPALASSEQLQDVTTVTLASGLVLTKTVDVASARPGDYLVYTISYENPGTGALSNLVIRDATPAWTVFDSATCAAAADGITGCALTQPAPGANGTVTWTLAGALAPGGRGSVSYRVRVQ
ncbi:MAG: DUF11 domain-containing protein [Candidatus Eisenbacteria bacterium]|uniref:DUF11 domain-containing protein n=1 Tax=Eiseniibacteriota bacterium TaxID=2212470 RepID=A0A933SD27_UNCEI|nr:DUF11 domain-containing protein [Candidatus Eisenbacteria bacterium]